MGVRKIKGKEEFDKVCSEAAKSSKFVVVDFFATWCGPCKQISPFLEELAKKYEAKAIVVSVDVDEDADLAQEMGVSAMPTFHKYKGSHKVAELVGANKDKLEALFTTD